MPLLSEVNCIHEKKKKKATVKHANDSQNILSTVFIDNSIYLYFIEVEAEIDDSQCVVKSMDY